MSLYHEAAVIISQLSSPNGSLKSRIYNNKTLKSSPAHIYAIVSETVKWNAALKEVIERSQLLEIERKLTPTLALLLVHDFLLSKRGIATAANHSLKTAITKHKARLTAEFTKARIRAGFATVAAWKLSLESSLGQNVAADQWPHPRWVRVNTLITTLDEQLRTTFANFSQFRILTEILRAPANSSAYYVDENIPDLIALPPETNITDWPAYTKGFIVIQDKASCFPAYLLDPTGFDGDIIDACAAPGNKTSHLAALRFGGPTKGARSLKCGSIWACEKDEFRSLTLKKMLELVGAEDLISIRPGQDFLRIDPNAPVWGNVEALLLDPSCSGSGIIGRDDTLDLMLPMKRHKIPARKSKSKKKTTQISDILPNEEQGHENSASIMTARLKSLSTFQLKLLLHAFSFPHASRITYSTCSIHSEENEQVVVRALSSDIAKQRGWRLLLREEQVSGLKNWALRGNLSFVKEILSNGNDEDSLSISEGCIRCDKSGEDGTMGFFLAAFVRGGAMNHKEEAGNSPADEWKGFDDSEDGL
ncbi:MAG: hypothetical protein M1829_006933 [Trizodia sp. TS-e1964]|nr:MAG: hypothetical protein M1829_006933 [Trizodia sp. TS-e1964]